jgi:alcohol dehydrogenase (NADP+)
MSEPPGKAVLRIIEMLPVMKPPSAPISSAPTAPTSSGVPPRLAGDRSNPSSRSAPATPSDARRSQALARRDAYVHNVNPYVPTLTTGGTIVMVGCLGPL